MKSQTASLTKAQKNRQEAKLYLWHLTPPLRERFDHSPWWQKVKCPAREAMAWEIFRRHPDTHSAYLRHSEVATRDNLPESSNADFGAALRIAHASQAREQLNLVGAFGHSWPNLIPTVQKIWRRYLLEEFPPQHGYDPSAVIVLNKRRNAVIVQEADRNIVVNKAASNAASKTDPNLPRDMRLLVLHRQDDLLAECANQDRFGRILIAIDPRATPRRIAKAVQAVVEAVKLNRQTTGKTNMITTLSVVAKFERAYLEMERCQKRDDQLFFRYRKVIQPWSWPL